MADTTAIAILGSTVAAIVAYLLNGMSNRAVEQIRVDYATKLRYSEKMVDLLYAHNLMKGTIIRLHIEHCKGVKVLDDKTIIQLIDDLLALEFSGPLIPLQSRLATVRSKMQNQKLHASASVEKELIDTLSSAFRHCLYSLDREQQRLLLVTDTEEVMNAYTALLSSNRELLNAMEKNDDPGDAIDELERLQKASYGFTGRFLGALQHELRYTVHGFLGKLAATRHAQSIDWERFHQFDDPEAL